MSSDRDCDGGARQRVRPIVRGASVVSEEEEERFEDARSSAPPAKAISTSKVTFDPHDAISRHPAAPPSGPHHSRHDSEDYGDLELLPPLEAFLQENASLCGSLENDLLPSTPLTEEQIRAARDEDVANVPINRFV